MTQHLHLQAPKDSAPRNSPQVFTPARPGRLQRQPACCGKAASWHEEDERLRKQLFVQRSPSTPLRPISNGGSAPPPAVQEVLTTSGHPLEAQTRGLMEPRFGHDFSRVRVHFDDQAASSARAVNALAYTVGQNIVFGAGQYAPATRQGQQLLAHELTHVVQQQVPQVAGYASSTDTLEAEANAASRMPGDNAFTVFKAAQPGLVQRQEASFPPRSQADPARLRQLQDLLVQITTETSQSLTYRARLEALAPADSLQRQNLENALNQSRTNLIRLLEQRMDVLRVEISSLNLRIGPTPSSSPGHPELEALGFELLQREGELRQHEQQLQPLRLWQTRREIAAVQRQIEQIDRDIFDLPPLDPAHPSSNMNDPRVQALMAQRARLEQQQRRLAATRTEAATRYQQSDPRWGSRRYGTAAECTNIAAAGCGPTSLAILLNYLFQEDPELAAGGNLEIVLPPATADYAATNGRVCNNGTVGDTMVTNVETQWPGFRGTRISLDQTVSQLRSGNLVIFLCHSCTGQDAGGQNQSYGGHYMVLNGVNADASQFDVIDPAGRNVVKISRGELSSHSSGFWTVTRK